MKGLLNLFAPFAEIWGNRVLLMRMVQRDIHSRYHGSVFGIIWAIATPLMLLAAYWLVLGRLIGAKWGKGAGEAYPLILFAGLVVHLCFAEAVGRSTSLVLEHRTYVKKVVFPLGILSMMVTMTALFHFFIGLVMLFVGQLMALHTIPSTWIYVPCVVLALVPMSLGISWVVSSLSVYIRDIQQVVPLLLTLMMFISPIFFPLDILDESVRSWFYLNPLTIPIEQLRRVAIEGVQPEWLIVTSHLLAAITLAILGGWWFARTKDGFADVL